MHAVSGIISWLRIACGTSLETVGQWQAESKVSQNYIHMITEEAHMAFYHLQICRRHLSLHSSVILNWLSHYTVRVFLPMMMMPFKPCYFIMLLMSALSGL